MGSARASSNLVGVDTCAGRLNRQPTFSLFVFAFGCLLRVCMRGDIAYTTGEVAVLIQARFYSVIG
jgi:hypothetical protein